MRMLNRTSDTRGRSRVAAVFIGALLGLMALAHAPLLDRTAAAVLEPERKIPWRQQLVEFLGATVPEHPMGERQGMVGEIVLAFFQRPGQGGMVVTFEEGEGVFSPQTQAAILLAIDRAARIAGLRTDSWNVTLTVHEPDAIVYGDSLTAMVALSVIAAATGDVIQPNRIITGTVQPTGELGMVSAVPLKVEAAHARHLQRVIIPTEGNVRDGDWRTPFLMQISPVRSLHEAYEALTGSPLAKADRS